MVKKNKRQQSIKGKLLAAICMLLVSSIMMVSTTYAWFTLSTAPEVTGINTAVGANGSLEMALVGPNGDLSNITSTVGQSYGVTGADNKEVNLTWGNLVDLNDGYGLENITLMPSELVLAEGLDNVFGNSPLRAPQFGADGRPTEWGSGSFGVYDGANFYASNDYGVRGIGIANGMTDRQLAFRDAQSRAAARASLAKSELAMSLRNNAPIFGNLALTHAGGDDTGAYTQEDMDALAAIVADLQEAHDYAEEAYMQYILAYSASAAVTGDGAELLHVSVASQIAGLKDGTIAVTEGKSKLQSLLVWFAAQGANTSDFDTYADHLATVQTSINTARTALENQADKEAYDWADISSAMSPLVAMEGISVNGYAYNQIKDNMNAVVNQVIKDGKVKVQMSSGIYAELAKHLGSFEENTTLKNVTVSGNTFDEFPAQMIVKINGAAYLDVVGSAVIAAGAPAAEGGEALPITEFYGYVIDLAFRTNAASSDLLLQSDPVDRIYDTNDDQNSETWGHGSSMTFKKASSDLTNDQLKELMSAIRIIFFTPGPATNTILVEARLDWENAVEGADGWTAKMYIYATVTEDVTYTHGDGATATEYTVYSFNDGTSEMDLYSTNGTDFFTLSADATTMNAYTVAEDATAPVKKTQETKRLLNQEGDSQKITALTQNTAQAVSVMVYMDGNVVDNSSVSATGTASLTGTMNLQFASSAELDPMDYNGLMNQEEQNP